MTTKPTLYILTDDDLLANKEQTELEELNAYIDAQEELDDLLSDEEYIRKMQG